MVSWAQASCKECDSTNIVYDRTTDTEICADCGVVQDHEIGDVNEYANYGCPDAMGTGGAYAAKVCFGDESASGGGGFDTLPSGVSRRTIAIASKRDTSASEIATKFGDLVQSKCTDRTGIRGGVHKAAADILAVVLDKGVKSATTRNVSVYAAVCVHLATKLERCERTDMEIMALFDVKPKRFSAVSSDVLTALAGHPMHAKIAASSRPLSLFPRLLHLMDETRLDPDLYRIVYKASNSELYKRLESELVDAGISGNVISAALFHLASDRKASTASLAETVGVTNQTVMKAIKIALHMLSRKP